MKKLILAVISLAAISPVFASPHLNANQKAAGCSILDGQVFCSGPGTGMCWKQGHDPNLGQPAEAIDVGTDPAPGVDERMCSGWTDAVGIRMVNGAIHVIVQLGSWQSGVGSEGHCHGVGGLVAEEHDENQLLRISVPSGDHSPGDLALSPIHA
jgi:hypothetical protein